MYAAAVSRRVLGPKPRNSAEKTEFPLTDCAGEHGNHDQAAVRDVSAVFPECYAAPLSPKARLP